MDISMHVDMHHMTPPQVALPTQHFIDIANNGTILGITDTITGFMPSQLLMRTVYDGIYHEDLVGFKAVQTYFWNRGKPEAQVYIRRQTAKEDWVWVVAKVASYRGDPASGMILHETCFENQEKAKTFSRITRIMALLARGMEDATKYATADNKKETPHVVNPQPQQSAADIPGLADDAEVLRQLLENSNDPSVAPLLQLVESAKAGGPVNISASESKGTGSSRNPSPELTMKRNDSPSVLNLVNCGINIDLGKVRLSELELKMVIMILKGHITVENLSSFILGQINEPREILSVIEGFRIGEKQRKNNRRHGSSSDIRHHGHNSSQSSKRHHHHHHADVNKSQSDSNLQDTDSLSSSNTDNVNVVNGEQSAPLHITLKPQLIPNIGVINLSFTEIGNSGMRMFCGYLGSETSSLKTLDLSFCNLEERGISALCQSLRKRRDKGYPSLLGLILTGNVITYKAAKDLGSALSIADKKRSCHKVLLKSLAGYDEDDEFDVGDFEDDFYDDDLSTQGGKRTRLAKSKSTKKSKKDKDSSKLSDDNPGIQLLHLGSTSLSSEALYQLAIGLGPDCNIRELNISSNQIGPDGISPFLEFLEGAGIHRSSSKKRVMPKLDRIDVSNNDLGNNGVAGIARAISKRTYLSMVNFHLSFNNISSGGTGTIMNKLLRHNLQALSLDNNVIGDEGCQLVAASLSSMHHLVKLNMSFNQIGSRGITSLMKAIVGCETLKYLGLSGNVMKISGAIAMGFALAQHPRLSYLDLDNCCLSQVAQCHIVAGSISNRWVPMQKMNGFQVGPPMVAIGALGEVGQFLPNEECFNSRRNLQMNTILQWMANKSATKENSDENKNPTATSTMNHEANNNTSEGNDNFLTVDFVSTTNDENSPPSQSAYKRMLDWLSRIPFDEDELNDLRFYFYDADDGKDGDRESQGKINLKQRGDLLAALGSEADKIREENNTYLFDPNAPPVGLSLESEPENDGVHSAWNQVLTTQDTKSNPPIPSCGEAMNESQHYLNSENDSIGIINKKKRQSSELSSDLNLRRSPMSSKQSLSRTESERSTLSRDEARKQTHSSRITKFPHFLAKLDLLKANAQEMMDKESFPGQQDIIAQQFAEASLTLLRQLRYHCMNSRLDGWRQGNIKRKVLIIDDSIVTRKLIARSFEKANFVVDTAENGELGVQMMKESIYDIAFMDIEMPVMNGFDATKALREWEDIERPGARQPICALTAAYVDDFERSELMKFKEAGLDVMESKPCNIPRLFKVVDDVSPMFSDLSISITQQLHTAATLS